MIKLIYLKGDFSDKTPAIGNSAETQARSANTMKSIVFGIAYLIIVVAALLLSIVGEIQGLDANAAFSSAMDAILITLTCVTIIILILTILFRQKDGNRYLSALKGEDVEKSIEYFKKAMNYHIIASVAFPATAYYISLCFKYGRHDEAIEFMKKHPKFYKYRALTYFYCLKELYLDDVPSAKVLLFELEKGGKRYDKQIFLIERLVQAAETGYVGDLMFLQSTYPIVNEIIDKIVAKNSNVDSKIAIEVNENIEEV